MINLGILPAYGPAPVTDPEYVAAFARVLEEEGCESVWAVEHVVVPSHYVSKYPYASDARILDRLA